MVVGPLRGPWEFFLKLYDRGVLVSLRQIVLRSRGFKVGIQPQMMETLISMTLFTESALRMIAGPDCSTYSHIRLLDENQVASWLSSVLTTWTCRTIVVAMTLVNLVSQLRHLIDRGPSTHNVPVRKIAITANLTFQESCKDQTMGIGRLRMMVSVIMLT